VGGLSHRDVLFLACNAVIGIAVGALVLRWPGFVPPVLWLVLGMGIVEIGGALLFGHGGPLVTYGMRILGLATSFAAYAVVSSAFGHA
jgi:hypothetical protein